LENLIGIVEKYLFGIKDFVPYISL